MLVTLLLPTFLESCSLTLGEISHMPEILRAALARKDHFRSWTSRNRYKAKDHTRTYTSLEPLGVERQVSQGTADQFFLDESHQGGQQTLLQTQMTKPCHNTFLTQKGVTQVCPGIHTKKFGEMGLYDLHAHVGLQIIGRNLTTLGTKTEVGLWRWKSSARYHQLQVVSTWASENMPVSGAMTGLQSWAIFSKTQASALH